MRELTKLEQQQLEQHRLWVESAGSEGTRLNRNRVNLNYTDLHGANLHGANLRGAKYINAISIAGSRGDTLIWNYHPHVEGGLMFKTGCFWGALTEFEAAVECVHGADRWGAQYRALIALAKVDAERWKMEYEGEA